MTESTNSPLYEVIWQTRRLFQRLRAASDELHEDIGVTTSQRAVLEFLSLHQPQTVPQMAREKTVSRQHIQMIVNKLLERGWVECIANPAHTRSSLLRMTSTGTQLFVVIRRRETKLLAVLEKQLARKKLLITAQTLQFIDEYLQSKQWRDSLPPQSKGETS